MRERAAANVYAIAPGTPFITTLVQSVRSGQLGIDAPDPDDPLALASTTVYVPTRRAARALRAAFAETSPSSSAILPKIRPLGDFDEDAGFLSLDMPESLSLAPPITGDDRLLALARLTGAWSKSLAGQKHAIMQDEAVLLPRTPQDAIWLARDLASVIDELEREGIPFEKLADINPDMLPAWWQITREFLQIVTEWFPRHLADQGLSDPVSYRNILIRAEAQRLRQSRGNGPVIAAGSTGSIPATAELLEVIAHLPFGAVVLPGLDRTLDDISWDLIGAGKGAASAGHPQYGLRKLLDRFGLMKGDVRFLGQLPSALAAREKLVSESLRPAETTDLWPSLRLPAHEAGEALADIALIEAPTEREEALAIALALRDAVDEKRVKTAALVTNDRNLARRVSAELLRFGVKADDSGGSSLANSPQAVLFQLILKTAFEADDPLDLLGLVKHPLAQFGENRQRIARAAEALELIAFRGLTGRLKPEDLRLHVDKACQRAEKALRKPYWMTRLTDEEVEDAQFLATLVSETIAPLAQMRAAASELNVPDAIRMALDAFETIGRNENLALSTLYAGDAGDEFAAHLRGLLVADAGFTFAPRDFPSAHAALLSGKLVKPKGGGDPNIFIWGALEARLQDVDTLILGGLNENTWPARTKDDPFLSHGMKASLSLEPPERRIGQAAHDFMMALGTRNLVLSRALRSERAPTIASRWLQRLTAYIGETQTKALQRRGQRFLSLAGQADKRPDIPLAARPAPSPPVHLRPKHFSVTEIKTLRQNPYAIHAGRILKLRPLDPLIRDPDPRERGNLFHDILCSFVAAAPDLTNAAEAGELLLAMARRAFASQELPSDVEALWWPRFEELVPAIIGFEQERIGLVERSLTEIQSQNMHVGTTGVTLSGRADRVDITHDKSVDIIDYKTGNKPTAAAARSLTDPQLALEAALVMEGGFAGLGKAAVNDLIYYRLKTKGEVKVESILGGKNELSAEALARKAWQRLAETLEFYARPDARFKSHLVPAPGEDGDYDHLARLAEWSSAAENDAGDGDE